VVFGVRILATTHVVIPRIRRNGETIKIKSSPIWYWALSGEYNTWFARNSPLNTKTRGARTIRSMPLRFVNRDFVEGIFGIFINSYIRVEFIVFFLEQGIKELFSCQRLR
jgi:hypothetical protein